jgi:glyoxylase-like metal-dependent hydrolase (beta-lactamase superfamily II)
MHIRRLFLSTVFVIAAGLALWISRGEAQPGTVKEIVPGVWFREGDPSLGHCNNIIIEMKDYLIVVDANFPSGAQLALDAAKKVSSKPVKYVFDTHHHGDHAYGNPVWTKAGATTLAYVGVVEEMNRYEPKRWQEAATEREDVRALGLSTAERPVKTFKDSPFVLEDATRRVEFHHFGWAHTRGDGFAYLPKEKVLCTGDAVVNGPYNYTGDGNTANWPNVVSKAQKLDIKHVLPGHGGPADASVLEGQKQFFLELSKAVEAAVKANKKLEDIVTMEGDQAKATTIQLPDSVKNWVGDFFAGQVKVRYAEITEGKPHGEITGGK